MSIMRVLKKKIPKNVNMLTKKDQEDITRYIGKRSLTA